MIKDLLHIFIPEKFKDTILVSKRVLSIVIENEKVIGTVTVQKGKNLFIDNIIIKTFTGDKSQRNTLIVAALKEVAQKAGSYDKIVTTISSSLITFKELSLPFIDEEKIKLILPFEVDALLPFDASNAAIDFIITKRYSKEKRSDIIVAAIQKKYIQGLLDLFKEAQLEITTITTDIIALYQLFLRRKLFHKGSNAFIEFKESGCNVLFFIDKQLKYIRTIKEPFVKDGENEALWSKISFTLESFKTDTATGESLKKILFFGPLSKDSITKAKDIFDASGQLFDAKRFFLEEKISYNQKISSLSSATLGIAATLPLLDDQSFSLTLDALNSSESSLVSKQLITGFLLLIFILGLLGGNTFYQINKLSNEVKASEKETLTNLRKGFPLLKKASSLSSSLSQAHQELKKQESIWSSLSQQTRQSFLFYLNALSIHLEREVLGLNLKKLSLNKNMLLLEGSVRNFEAIEQFEQQLKKTDLFLSVPDLQSIEFKISLPLKIQGGSL